MPDNSSPAWSFRRTNGRNILVLGGDWIAQSGRIPEFPDRDLLDNKRGGALAFDTAALGRWDSGLIEFLWDAKRAAITGGIAIDAAPCRSPRASCLACSRSTGGADARTSPRVSAVQLAWRRD